jgi:hypothetical protein
MMNREHAYGITRTKRAIALVAAVAMLAVQLAAAIHSHDYSRAHRADFRADAASADVGCALCVVAFHSGAAPAQALEQARPADPRITFDLAPRSLGATQVCAAIRTRAPPAAV